MYSTILSFMLPTFAQRLFLFFVYQATTPCLSLEMAYNLQYHTRLPENLWRRGILDSLLWFRKNFILENLGRS